ncbi:hypothetical protein, partial [Glaciecola sp. KUL10]|uniref:hypothetical protein n=1 Tax=Glaciecola sp. (strain KUL10) TaxID=2161813 RepID=UPI0011B75169
MRKLLRAILSILVCILVIPTAYAQVLSTNWQVVADIDDAVSFSVAADGTIAFIKSDGASFIKFASGEAIQTINADLTAIEVIDRNSFWGITTGNQLVKFDNGNWQQYLSNVSHIDLSNNGNLGVVRDSGDTEIYNAQMQLLDVLVGKVSKVFVSEQARHWAIDGASNTSRLIPNQWLGVDGKAMDINISANQRTLMVGLDEQIYEWDAEQTNWQLFASNAPSKQIEISEQDEFWRLGSDGLLYFLGDRDINDGINTSEPNGDGGSQGPQDPELILNFDFSAVNQAAQDIIIGPDGRVIAKLSEFSFALWSNRTRSFQQIAGRISDVNIDSLGNVFAISEGRKLLSLSESGWNEEPLDGFYTEIESGPNNGLLLLAPDLSLFRLDRASLAPIKLFDNVVEFAFSQQANELWYLDNQQNIFKCTQLLSCQRVAGQALDISLGQNGQVFIVDTNFLLKVYSADQQNFVQTNKANVLKVATGPNEMPWVLTNQGQIERTTLFERDEGDDLRILELARRTQDETQSSLSLTGTLFEVSNSLLYVPSVDACQAVIGEFSVGLTSQNSFAIEDLSLRGSAQRFLSLQASSFNNVTKQQTIEILINCEALPTLNNNAYFADISLNLVDEVSQLNVQAQRRFNVDISVLSLQSNTLGLSQSHNVGLSQCPQSFQSIEITSSDQAFFSLRDVRLSEELSEIMVISANLASSALSHSIESSFNCADLTPGIYRGEIIVDAVQSDSGAISQKVFPVELEVFIEPIEVSLSAQSLFLSHSVGFSSCPNDFEVVTASITENRAFRFESLEVTGSIAPVVNVLNSGNTAASQQEIQIQFNCAQLRVANYSGQLTAIAISEISGATQEVSINLSLEVVIDPIDILLSSNAISLTHSVGVSSCPQSFEVVTASTADN